MSPNSHKYKKEYSFQLLRIAEGDLNSAIALASAAIGRPENIVYLTQQSIEKNLKALLCYLGQPIVHTHDLDVLVALLPSDKRPPCSYQLGTLSQYATIRRYEEGYELVTKEDLENTINIGKQVLSWVSGIIR